MELLLSVVVLSITVSQCGAVIRPNSGLRECRTNSTLTALEVLPGGGWDNLRNIDMGRVMNMSFSQCQTTEDGLYFIPDEVFVVPQKTSGVETFSETIMSWLEQKSSTSGSINADVSFLHVMNGKFSEENQRMKTQQVKGNSATTRVQVRNHLYTVNTYPDFTLDARFAQQVAEIADALENNQTRQSTYLSEKLILDYGTHVITSVDAGATLVQEDYLTKSYISSTQSQSSSVSASAGISFFNKVNFNFDSKEAQQTAESQQYQQSVTYSLVQSHGGDLFYHGITLQKWQESTRNNLVAIDRSGLPLHYFLNPSMFPDLPGPTLIKLASAVQRASELYYNINMIPGCVDQASENFNFQANVDDASCQGPATNLSLGGVFQTCDPADEQGKVICEELEQKNPDTGGFTCRLPYAATLLHSESVEQPYNQLECHQECHSCWLVFDCCHNQCGNAYYVRRARIHTYWCSTNQLVPKYSGYLFGGLYGPSFPNPLTKSRSCPPLFFPQRFLTNGVTLCLSNDYEGGTTSSVSFGGIFSCTCGNPLAGNQYRCPAEFSQHLAAISDGCQILYCVKSEAFTTGQLKPVHLPPFTRPSLINTIATNTVVVMTDGDQAWLRVGDSKRWKLVEPGEMTQMARLFQPISAQMTDGEKAGLACGVVTSIAIVMAGIAVLMKRRRARRGFEEIRVEDERCERHDADEDPTQALLA